MNIAGQPWRSIWLEENEMSVGVVDQTKLPHSLITCSLKSSKDVIKAINSMVVRGAPLLGVTGAFGMMLALFEDPSDISLQRASYEIINTRPTAINLAWAVGRVIKRVQLAPLGERAVLAREEAKIILEEDINMCETIGINGLELIKTISSSIPKKSIHEPVNILTHCNAGWLGTVDWGTALAPIYKAHREGINMHIWVDETRPRNQGASLTVYELSQEGIPNTLIVDNAGGHLMQKGQVDAVFVGSDRITSRGDVCNKIGTYLKALAAYDNQIPFYVAAPYSTIDWSIEDGLDNIKIEERSADEVAYVDGIYGCDYSWADLTRVRVCPEKTNILNPGFDITPARLVSKIITEKGICDPSDIGLRELYPQLEK